jgi:hypothetical protein
MKRIHHARKLGNDDIIARLEDPAAMFRDFKVDQALQPFVRLLLARHR